MDFQTIAVTVLLVAAAAYLVRSIVLAARASSEGGCSVGCRCNDAAQGASDRLGRQRELIQLGSQSKPPSAGEAGDGASR